MALDLYELAIRFKSEGFAAVNKDLDTLDKKGKGIGKVFTALKATLIVGAVGGFIRKIAVESIEAQKQTAQLNAVLKSTGGIAGVTAGDIDKMAGSLQKTTVFSDEAVKSSAALLLTFTNIRGEIFKKTLPAITDMATALGTDLNSATLQVGKALQDPVRGITALRRAGVSFSEAQQAVIKNLVATNRLAEAQGIILKELNVQFGGSAEAARNTLGGALTGLSNAWGDLFEVTQDSSKGIIGAINSLADSLSGVRDRFDELITGITATFDVLRTFADLAIAAHFAIVTIFDPRSWRSNFEQLNAALKRIQDRMTGMNRAFSDVTSGSSSTAPRKAPAPLTSGGSGTRGKAGKSGGVQIPSFNMPDFQLPGTIFDDVDSGHLDMFGALVPDFEKVFEDYRKGREQLTADILMLEEAERQKMIAMSETLASTLGDAFTNAFAAAFNGEGLGGIFKAFGQTILSGLGGIFIQMGTKMIAASAIMEAFSKALIAFLPGGGLVAGIALVALGSAMVGAGGGGGGGRGRGGYGGGGGGYGRGTEEMTRLKFVNRDGTAAGLTPRQAIHFTVIGASDPKAQREIMALIRNGERRLG